jgi:hypothetical protein
MAKLFLLVVLSAMFAAAILAGPSAAARHQSKAPTVTVVTTVSSPVPVAKGQGGGRFHY